MVRRTKIEDTRIGEFEHKCEPKIERQNRLN